MNKFCKYYVFVLVLVLSVTLVSCNNNVELTDENTDQNIQPRVDYLDEYVAPVSIFDLPELDDFTIPKVTGTTAELAFGYIPKSLNESVSKYGFNLLTFTNIKHGLERFDYYGNSPSDLDLILATMYSPDFLVGRIHSQKQPIDNPNNWNWMVYDRISGGTWFAGDLSMGEKLLPAMTDDNYSSEPLLNSSMTSFVAPLSNKAPIYGRQVTPYSPKFGYFNFKNKNIDQADETGVLIRQKKVGLTSEAEISDLLQFIGDAENAVLIKSELTLENFVSNLGIPPANIDDTRMNMFENLRGFGRHIGLDWIAFSHNPKEEYELRIILRYRTNQIAEIDMKLLKYIHENNLTVINQSEEISMNLINFDKQKFSVYQNIGIIECNIVSNDITHETKDPVRTNDIRAAEKLSELFLNGLIPELFLNK